MQTTDAQTEAAYLLIAAAVFAPAVMAAFVGLILGLFKIKKYPKAGLISAIGFLLLFMAQLAAMTLPLGVRFMFADDIPISTVHSIVVAANYAFPVVTLVGYVSLLTAMWVDRTTQ